MSFLAQGRGSDSPYVESIWRGTTQQETSFLCPADGRWNILFTWWDGKVRISVEGPMTRAIPKTHGKGIEWLAIKFKLGTFLRDVPARLQLDGEVLLSLETLHSFWLGGSIFQLPDYENADTFVDWLVRRQVLLSDPVVMAALADQPHQLSSRTLRHRFLHATGLSQTSIRQIERARSAASLLQQGVSILDVVVQAGYADQPHLTRSLGRFLGQTPASFAAMHMPVAPPLASPYAALVSR
ncbi:MAG: helix-turn-helix transcriptional regulator [Ktedonobacteraceae bacterium]|nr:helix-turn-helix transcriptional regulator [Ktedonobacteraceae bacterium]